jgi:dUTP pyrophosphatase
MMEMRFDGVAAPKQAKPGDAGFDLKSYSATSIPPHQRSLVNTGLRVAIPAGYAGLVLPRSGLAAKHGVTVLNAPGLIDSGYRGEIGVLLVNHSEQYFDVNIGDRIAQLVIVKVECPDMVWGILDDTERGAGGFGSTGS